MFGRNTVVKPHYGDGSILAIKEIFGTIQGEGPRVGEPAVFVRVAGCNLRCFFCDTEFENGKLASVEEVVDAVRIAKPDGAGLVVITGGEPLAQELGPLCAAIDAIGMYVQIETAGTCWPPSEIFDDLCQRGIVEIVCSPKTPVLNEQVQIRFDALKYIVRAGETSDEDGLPIRSTQDPERTSRIFRADDASNIFLQPMMEYHQDGSVDEEKTKANTDEAIARCLEFGYRLSLQMHKIIGMP